MKRWKFLLAIFVSLSIALLSVFYAVQNTVFANSQIAAIPVLPGTSVNAQTQLASFDSSKLQLSKIGIELSINPSLVIAGAKFSKYSETDKEALKLAKIIAEEWQKYDTTSIKDSGLKKIYIVNNLIVDGQFRSGMPEPIFEDALYFDASAKYVDSEGGDYIRRTLHHEFKHLIDYNQHGSYRYEDILWLSCNTKPNVYKQGGAAMQNNPDYAHAEHPEPGFVNGYSTSAIEEDRAEVYALLLTNPAKLQNMAKNDASLQCKIAKLR